MKILIVLVYSCLFLGLFGQRETFQKLYSSPDSIEVLFNEAYYQSSLHDLPLVESMSELLRNTNSHYLIYKFTFYETDSTYFKILSCIDSAYTYGNISYNLADFSPKILLYLWYKNRFKISIIDRNGNTYFLNRIYRVNASRSNFWEEIVKSIYNER